MKNSWFRFNTTDWRVDSALNLCSLSARGLWIEMLAIMHEANPRGHLLIKGRPPTNQELAHLVGATLEDVQEALVELENSQVFDRRKGGVIVSRRMVREDDYGRKMRENGKKGGHPTHGNHSIKTGRLSRFIADGVADGVADTKKSNDSGDGGLKNPRVRLGTSAREGAPGSESGSSLRSEQESLSSLRSDSPSLRSDADTPPTPSRTPSETLRRKTELTALAESTFPVFWSLYPRRTGKADALRAWTKIVVGGGDPHQVIERTRQYAAERLHEDAKFTPHASTWLNGRRFEDEPGGTHHGIRETGTPGTVRQNAQRRSMAVFSELIDELARPGQGLGPRPGPPPPPDDVGAIVDFEADPGTGTFRQRGS